MAGMMQRNRRTRLDRWLAGLASLALLVAAGACSSPDDGVEPEAQADARPLDEPPALPGEVQASDVERELSPAIAPGDLEALVADNTAFAVDMYHGVRTEDGNLFMSPLSVSMALAMTYAGARENTADQIADTMHFSLSGERLHAAFNALDLALDSRGIPADGSEDRLFQLNLTNATFGQVGYPFLQDYIDLLARHYESGLSLLDFAADPDIARMQINDWIAAATNDRILDMLPPNSIARTAKLVLVNSIYFNANWRLPFGENSTEPAIFKGLSGDITVDMMSGAAHTGYHQGPDYEAFTLDYDGNELDMVLIVPDEGMLETVESALSSQFLTDLFAAVDVPVGGRLNMPKFEFRSKFKMRDLLIQLGMTDAFTEMVANFSGVDGTMNLSIAEVLHEAFVAVDEEGTEAAAVTVVLPPPPSTPPPPSIIDRPFMFMIRDKATGTILFVGRVVDPTAT